jgi:hypothetical protein
MIVGGRFTLPQPTFLIKNNFFYKKASSKVAFCTKNSPFNEKRGARDGKPSLPIGARERGRERYGGKGKCLMGDTHPSPISYL